MGPDIDEPKDVSDFSTNRISVIVVCYHSRHLLPGLLQDVNRLVPGIAEVLLVNNGLEDLSSLESGNTKVLFPGKNLGYGAGLNYGVKRATGDLFLFLNPDVVLTLWTAEFGMHANERFIVSGIDEGNPLPNRFPGLLSELVKYLLDFLWGPLARPFEFCSKRSGKYGEYTCKADWVSGGLIFTSRFTLDTLGGFDEGFFLYYEETDLCKRAGMQGVPVYLTSHIRYIHDFGKSSGGQGDERKQQELIRSLWRYHSKYESPRRVRILFYVLYVVWSSYAFMFRVLFLVTHVNVFLRSCRKFGCYAGLANELLGDHVSLPG